MISLFKVLLKLTCPYSVDDIYITTNNVNPNTKWPWTTWIEFSQGKELVGHDPSHTYFSLIGETGGAKGAWYHTHDHSTKSHTHSITLYFNANSGTSANYHYHGDRTEQNSVTLYTNSVAPAIQANGSSGNPTANVDKANLQPYQVVKMWRRTA